MIAKNCDRRLSTVLPLSADQLVPEDHLARFIVKAVDKLDLSELMDTYSDRGPSAYHPSLMLALVIYAYIVGKTSSREIEEACGDSVSFMYIANRTRPDHTAISRFRTRVMPFFPKYFNETLRMAAEAGYLDCSDVFLDGTKIKADASRHRAFSYGKAAEIVERLTAEIDRLEGEIRNDESLRDRLQSEIDLRARKIAHVTDAIGKMEDMFEATSVKDKEDYEAAMAGRAREIEAGRKPRGKAPSPPADRPAPKAQVNMTDGDSRIMPASNKGWIQGYNAQALVAKGGRFIVGGFVSQNANDVREMDPELIFLLYSTHF